MDPFYTTTRISVYECVNNFPKFRLKVHSCCRPSARVGHTNLCKHRPVSPLSDEEKRRGGMVRESLSTFCLKLGTGRKRCRLGLGGSRTIRCSGSLPCPLQPSLQDSWLWRGIGRC